MQAGTGLVLDALVARLAATPGRLFSNIPLTRPALRHCTPSAAPSASGIRQWPLICWRRWPIRRALPTSGNLGPDIAVAVPAGERLAIRSAPAALPRVTVGSEFDLTVDPRVPLGGTFAWTIVTPGPGDAHFIAHSADPPLLRDPDHKRDDCGGKCDTAFRRCPRNHPTGHGDRRSYDRSVIMPARLLFRRPPQPW